MLYICRIILSFGPKKRKRGEKLRLSYTDFHGLLLCLATHGFEVRPHKGHHLRGCTPPLMSIASEEEFIYFRVGRCSQRGRNHGMFHESGDIFTDTT